MRLSVKNITKTDLAKYLESELKCSRRNSVRLINGILEFLKKNLAGGHRVQLNPFGTFELRYRAEHRGKNPKTGETFLVNGKRVVVFKSGRALKHLRPSK